VGEKNIRVDYPSGGIMGKRGRILRCGCTTVEFQLDKDERFYLKVTHAGNMGNTISSVEKNIQRVLGFPKGFIRKNEKGTPDYWYEADFYLK